MRRHRLLDRTLVIYLAVNIFCWLVGTGLMFLLFNVFHGSYWVSSACNYIVGGTLGYLLNRKYTFRNHAAVSCGRVQIGTASGQKRSCENEYHPDGPR